MWADTSSDGSVMMGLYGGSFKVSLEKIFQGKEELEPGVHFENVEPDILTSNAKISFHQSGQYKFENKIKRGSIDRTTIKGIPLGGILEPTRMLEILIPASISIANTQPNEEKDFVIDITDFPNKPLR